MPNIRTKETFECSFCGALCKSHGGALNHERRCPRNPANGSACFSCKNLIHRNQACAIFDHNGNDLDEKVIKDFYCSKLDRSMMTYKCPRHILNIHPHYLHLMPSKRESCPQFEVGMNQYSDETNPSDQ